MFQARYFYIQLHVLLAQRRSMKPEPRKTPTASGNDKHHRATCSCQNESALSKMYTVHVIKMVQKSMKCIKRTRVAQTAQLFLLIHTIPNPRARVAVEMSWHLHLHQILRQSPLKQPKNKATASLQPAFRGPAWKNDLQIIFPQRYQGLAVFCWFLTLYPMIPIYLWRTRIKFCRS